MILHLWGYPQGVFNNQTHSTLQEVLNDYPNHFSSIKGSLLNEDPQSVDFNSKISIPGSLNAVITRYSGPEDKEIYSWKCTLLASDDYELAASKYKDVFNQLKNSIIKIEGEKPFILSGSLAPPTEEKRFISSSLQLLPAASGDLGKVKVELTMEFLVTEWKISILVYDQEEEALVME
jgi:hypothetical protein